MSLSSLGSTRMLREVHRPRVEAVDAAPRLAVVLRDVDAAGLIAVLALVFLDVRLLPADGPVRQEAAVAGSPGRDRRRRTGLRTPSSPARAWHRASSPPGGRRCHLVAGLARVFGPRRDT